MPLFDTRDPNSTVHAEWEAARAKKKLGPPAPLSSAGIFWAVLGALCAFALLIVILSALLS
jgi:hypothetical protein